MILAAIKRLHLRKVYVPSNLISEYIRGSYPVENNVRMFTEELKRKLECAVRVGLILKHGEDLYYLPTLRQKANALKSAFTAFWEIYKNVIINISLCALQILFKIKQFFKFTFINLYYIVFNLKTF